MKLFKFVTLPAKQMDEFLTCPGILPQSIFLGWFLVVTQSGKFYQMNAIKSKRAKLFKNAVCYAKFPCKSKDEIIFLK